MGTQMDKYTIYHRALEITVNENRFQWGILLRVSF